MSDIPSDLLKEILRRVTGEPLLRFRTVCKEWRRIIDDPSFVRIHAHTQISSNTLLIKNSTTNTLLYSLNLDTLNHNESKQTIEVTAVKPFSRSGATDVPNLPAPSCHGLILNSHYYEINKAWVVWNPLTREFHELSQFKTKPGAESSLACLGIGYDCASHDFKVVRIDQMRSTNSTTTVHQTSIYSLKMNCWRIVKDCPYDFPGHRRPGIFLNGALHWVLENKIVVLVLGTEDYRELPMPANPPLPTKAEESVVPSLKALGGFLFMSYYCCERYPLEGGQLVEGWVMNDYGVEKSWTKLFSFTEHFLLDVDVLTPIAYIKSKGLVILQNFDHFLLFDIQSNSAKMVTISGLPSNFYCQIMPQSLFRLRHSFAVDVKSKAAMKRERKRKRMGKPTIKPQARVEHSVIIEKVRLFFDLNALAWSDDDYDDDDVDIDDDEDDYY
ncbi:hypothetical protein ABFX02_01G106000 [Erythranthe guttata]